MLPRVVSRVEKYVQEGIIVPNTDLSLQMLILGRRLVAEPGFRLSNGKILWQAQFDGLLEWLDVANGVVYLNTNAHATQVQPAKPFVAFYALQATNGSILWQRRLLTNFPVGVNASSTAVLSNGVIYATMNTLTPPHEISFTFDVSAFSTSDGRQLWRDQLTDSNASSGINFSTDLTGLNDVLYIGEMEEAPVGGMGRVLALHASDGKIIWHDDITPIGITDVQVLVATDKVYVGQNEHMISALQADNGAGLWQHKFGDSESGVFKLATSNGIIYVGTYPDTGSGHSVCAMQATDGTQLWCHVADAGIISVWVS